MPHNLFEYPVCHKFPEIETHHSSAFLLLIKWLVKLLPSTQLYEADKTLQKHQLLAVHCDIKSLLYVTVLCFRWCRKKKKGDVNATVHGSVLRHGLLKGISAQIVSAAVRFLLPHFVHMHRFMT